jgi:hypothetical protein
VFSVLGFKIDGNWFDICSMCCGVFWMLALGAQRRATARKVLQTQNPWLDPRTGMDFGNGLSLFPFAILFLSPLSSQLLDGLLQGGKLILSVAGLVALIHTARNA